MPSQKIETGHQDVVHDVAMDYYGKRLATASSDNTVKIMAVNPSDSSFPSQILATLTGHQGPVWQISWAHPKFGSILASCSYDGRVIIWKETKQNEWVQIYVLGNPNSSINSIGFAPHELGLHLACGSSDGTISILSERPDGNWYVYKIENAHPVGVLSVSWGPSSSIGSEFESPSLIAKIVSGGCDNSIKIWKSGERFDSWALESSLPSIHKDWIRDVSWAPSLGLTKSTIASASQDGSVVIWTLERESGKWEGKVLNDFRVPVWRVSWSTVGNILAVADGNNDVTLWKESVDGEWQKVSTVESE